MRLAVRLLLLLLCWQHLRVHSLELGARSSKSRVRKELRSLTPEEVKLLVVGLSTLLTVSTRQGQRLFGPGYKEYEYFIVKHAVSVNDPRGDQGHGGPCFATFHRAWLLELEAALLTVVPALGGLPYWDLTLDAHDGKYYQTSDWIYADKWLGSPNYNGTDPAVSTGLFAWREVHHFNAAKYARYAHIYNGSASTQQLRSPGNRNDNIYVSRFAVTNLTQYSQVAQGVAPAPGGPAGNLSYTRAMWEACLDPAAHPSWLDWHYCVDVTAVPKPLRAPRLPLGAGSPSLLHVGVHCFLGGLALVGDAVGGAPPVALMGDLFDVATSPNEVPLFFAHHANLDRSNAMWQARAAAANLALTGDEVMWGYPASLQEYNYTHDGCLLNDVVNQEFPFTDIFLVPPEQPEGYTHREVLVHTQPPNSYYVYA